MSGGTKQRKKKKEFMPLTEFLNSPQAPQASGPHGASENSSTFTTSLTSVAPVEDTKQTKANGNVTDPAVSKPAPVADTEYDSSICFICTEQIVWYAVGECNHRVCHICSLRLRALYKVKSCALCKTELHHVVFTKSATKPFSDFNIMQIRLVDPKLDVYFDEPDAMEDSNILLRFNCPDPSCDVACPNGWAQLKAHVKKDHGMLMCDLCTRHKKIFTHEHSLYTQSTLNRHYSTGDPDDPSFKGHPTCGFCNMSFYGDDELYTHCREKHEQCFLCQRAGHRNQYYVNWDSLNQHFNHDHHPCTEPECLEQKFMVFGSDLDLKAHQLEVHRDSSAKKSSKSKYQAVDVGFTYAGSPSRNNADRSRPSRSRDDNSSSANSSTNNRLQQRNQYAAPAGSLELPERTRTPVAPSPAVTAQTVNTPPGLGAPVTATSATTPSSTQQQQQPSQRKLRPPPGFGAQLSSADSNSAAAIPTSSSQAPPSPTRALDQSPLTPDADLNNILTSLLSTTPTSLSEFRESLRQYRMSYTTADDLLEKMISLAMIGRGAVSKIRKDTENEVGRAWTRLGSVLPDTEGEGIRGMLRAWNDWRAKRDGDTSATLSSYANPLSNAFPPTPTSSSNGGKARVLVIKSASSRQRNTGTGAWAASSSRPPSLRRNIVSSAGSVSSNNSTIWDRLADEVTAERSGASPANSNTNGRPVDFPTLGASSSSSSATAASQSLSRPSFVETAAWTPTVSSSYRNATGQDRSGSSLSRNREDVFPALQRTASSDRPSTPSGAWGTSTPVEEAYVPESQKKKKKGRQKDILLQFG
ncbi:hypothetical protein SmJEL517_g04159 [Synchytrium microbalum]|uniref:RING-type E3 ubiquitin transferase n=1 Tax=Synchytrium microbalum TaxID=1806994 RepID=A0A507C3V2_9FUNG|nr:uncharacterized protein SmJEL517_g04159 [Synchytrium microbalum]TPX32794.1 hypothetical protein SmJEL517_g04159 [Synchytrium microbalum]